MSIDLNPAQCSIIAKDLLATGLFTHQDPELLASSSLEELLSSALYAMGTSPTAMSLKMQEHYPNTKFLSMTNDIRPFDQVEMSKVLLTIANGNPAFRRLRTDDTGEYRYANPDYTRVPDDFSRMLVTTLTAMCADANVSAIRVLGKREIEAEQQTASKERAASKAENIDLQNGAAFRSALDRAGVTFPKSLEVASATEMLETLFPPEGYLTRSAMDVLNHSRNPASQGHIKSQNTNQVLYEEKDWNALAAAYKAAVARNETYLKTFAVRKDTLIPLRKTFGAKTTEFIAGLQNVLRKHGIEEKIKLRPGSFNLSPEQCLAQAARYAGITPEDVHAALAEHPLASPFERLPALRLPVPTSTPLQAKLACEALDTAITRHRAQGAADGTPPTEGEAAGTPGVAGVSTKDVVNDKDRGTSVA